MPDLTEKESENIRIEKNAFETFLGPVRIERVYETSNLFNVYFPANTNEPFTVCHTIDSVRGFLWGCVAGVEDERFKTARMIEVNLKKLLEERC